MKLNFKLIATAISFPLANCQFSFGPSSTSTGSNRTITSSLDSSNDSDCGQDNNDPRNQLYFPLTLHLKINDVNYTMTT
ncbi:MAG TPA: hypothetical protein DCM23_02850 [Firmicutes bacterium]|nr:hypothetical protein [Bacillota bacterium]HAV19671.1 hypothetical protein [Bacillota bacterium]